MVSYRNTLEVMKYSAPKDILEHTSRVSLLWMRAAAAEELWQSFVEDLGLDAESHSSYKDVYRYGRLTPALLSSTALYLFRPQNSTWRTIPLTTRISVDKSSSWAFTPEGNFICTGGGAGTNFHTDASGDLNSSYKILHSGRVIELHPMKITRKWHGSIVVRETCYVFGGVSGSQDTSQTEKLSLADAEGESWVEMQNMLHCRSSFNPCFHQGVVYIMGGKTQCCERFLCESESFERLDYILDHSHSSCFEFKGQLLVLQTTGLVQINFPGSTKRPESWQYVCGNMNPVVVGHHCYVPMSYNDFSVLQIDIESLVARKIPPPNSNEAFRI